jgi:alcohol dehydrogenase class IV
MGAGPELDERIVAHALLDHCHKTNPRLASADDYRAMLAASR